jgi:glutaminyl-tRNA synthetase
MENPPKKFFRLSPGNEVRLRSAYIIKCENVVKDPSSGQISEIHCTYDLQTRSGMPDSNRKVKGTLHWVSVAHALKAEVRLYDRLFSKENPDDLEEGRDYKDYLNPDSLKIITGYLEPSLAGALPGEKYQFERIGYFNVDRDSLRDKLIFNRTVTLKDSWAKMEKSH